MRNDARGYLFDLPGTYRIRIRGRLDAYESGDFACMMNCRSRVRGNPPNTTLTGVLLDQGGLISVLTQLFDLGYPLLDVKRLPDEPPAAPDNNLTQQLQQLSQLPNAGVLNDEEFAAARQKRLARLIA